MSNETKTYASEKVKYQQLLDLTPEQRAKRRAECVAVAQTEFVKSFAIAGVAVTALMYGLHLKVPSFTRLSFRPKVVTGAMFALAAGYYRSERAMINCTRPQHEYWKQYQ